MPTRSAAPVAPVLPAVATTGVAGLDVILHGGLPREEMHLVQGVAGTGKTTLALRFLCEGSRAGEPTLYVTLSQSRFHLERIARSHGWPLEGVAIHELAPGTVTDRIATRQTVLPTVDVELGELFSDLAVLVARLQPRRAVIDSITILEVLAGSSERYQREVVTLRQLFIEHGCTVMALADHPAEAQQGAAPEVIFHPLSGCVIHLEQQPRPFGDVRRRIRVVKARGMPHNGGYHDFKILTGRVEVYPRLRAYEMPDDADYVPVTSGIPTLDVLLGGGLQTGTSCLLVGPSGVGKSSVATAYVTTLAQAGERGAIFLFDERPETYIVRSESLGLPLRNHVASGRVVLRQLDPGEIAPGQFAQQIRELVERDKTRAVVIDSVIGYFAAMGAADILVTQLHELLTYLIRSGVLVMTLVTAARSAVRARRRQYEVRELLARERTAREQAESAMRLKDEFLLTVSHELRTPLSAILLWTQLLNSGLKHEQTSQASQAIKRSAEAQSLLIEDLLDVSRMLTGKLRLELRECQLAPIVEAAVEVVRPTAIAKGVRLDMQLDATVDAVLADADRMQQMVWNLLSNAVKFTPAGGRVALRLAQAHGHVEVWVTDTGKGIRPEFLPHVFERFRQADAASTRRHGGLGLGLAIVLQLVELHGGSVAVDSAGVGQGTTFRVHLPAASRRR